MKEETLNKLIDTGFTKDEILALVGVKPTEDVPPKKEEQLPKEEPKPDAKKEDQAQAVQLSQEQFTSLLQTLNAKGASIDVPPGRDVSNALNEHFKDLMIGG